MIKEPELYITKDSSYQDRPGFEGSKFKIYLNKRLQEGSIITNDVQFGSYLEVTEDEVVREGNKTYETTVKLFWKDDEYFIPSNLEKNVPFYIVLREEKSFSFINWFKKELLHKYF